MHSSGTPFLLRNDRINQSPSALWNPLRRFAPASYLKPHRINIEFQTLAGIMSHRSARSGKTVNEIRTKDMEKGETKQCDDRIRLFAHTYVQM